jgi:HD-like signal output (HDOD) protein
MLNAAQSAGLSAQIRAEISNNQIQLPTLPEVALKVRDAVERESTDAAGVADMVGNDSALSARLLQVANSPVYRGAREIDSIQQAVARLGMKQIFQATSEALDKQFRKVWDDSLQVAAISRVLANNVATLENEQAMLGGLIHNIGALPILTKIDEHCGYDDDEVMVAQLIHDLSPEIGETILQHWHFAESLADIPTACQDPIYDPGPVPTYADIVLVARLQTLSDDERTQVDWSHVPAFAKLGMEPEIVIVEMEGPAEAIAEVRSMLEG